MKRSVFLTSAVVVAMTVTAGSALAKRHGGMHGVMLSFEELDIDGNGEITEEEFALIPETRFSKADLDGDGVLSPEEMTAAGQQKLEQRVTHMIEKYDADGDGALSLEEMPQKGKGKGRKAGKMIDRADTDGNGSVSKAEFEEARSRYMARKSSQPDQN